MSEPAEKLKLCDPSDFGPRQPSIPADFASEIEVRLAHPDWLRGQTQHLARIVFHKAESSVTVTTLRPGRVMGMIKENWVPEPQRHLQSNLDFEEEGHSLYIDNWVVPCSPGHTWMPPSCQWLDDDVIDERGSMKRRIWHQSKCRLVFIRLVLYVGKPSIQALLSPEQAVQVMECLREILVYQSGGKSQSHGSKS